MRTIINTIGTSLLTNMEDDDGAVYVCDLTCRHEAYERLMDKVGIRRRNYGGFAILQSLKAVAGMEGE